MPFIIQITPKKCTILIIILSKYRTAAAFRGVPFHDIQPLLPPPHAWQWYKMIVTKADNISDAVDEIEPPPPAVLSHLHVNYPRFQHIQNSNISEIPTYPKFQHIRDSNISEIPTYPRFQHIRDSNISEIPTYPKFLAIRDSNISEIPSYPRFLEISRNLGYVGISDS
ncbi:unnamed protein product [Trichogramma brassicae]|uniref:Uncharacterized protein n=1 Tax=Trichogramma brassicae TaxID=86971 RepID=A0A6H5J253_9HYME|nr:unnamed protein product [Trichogramma brassicae]